MAKPEPVRPTVVAKPVIRTHVPASRVVAYRRSNGGYRVVREKYECEPTSTEVLHDNADFGTAEYEVRLDLENTAGPNRHGQSGL
jgi:hypothetical protein